MVLLLYYYCYYNGFLVVILVFSSFKYLGKLDGLYNSSLLAHVLIH